MAAAFDRVLKTQYFRYKLDPGSEMGEGDAMCLAQGEEPVQEAELYKVIQEKENDLVLAAELGKAHLHAGRGMMVAQTCLSVSRGELRF